MSFGSTLRQPFAGEALAAKNRVIRTHGERGANRPQRLRTDGVR